MQIARIEQKPGTVVKVFGKSQGYLGLPCRFEIVEDKAQGGRCISLTTAWTPTPDELAALNAGASVHVQQLYMEAPHPIMLTVSDIPA